MTPLNAIVRTCVALKKFRIHLRADRLSLTRTFHAKHSRNGQRRAADTPAFQTFQTIHTATIGRTFHLGDELTFRTGCRHAHCRGLCAAAAEPGAKPSSTAVTRRSTQDRCDACDSALVASALGASWACGSRAPKKVEVPAARYRAARDRARKRLISGDEPDLRRTRRLENRRHDGFRGFLKGMADIGLAAETAIRHRMRLP